jgi:hypothetical protein
MSFLDANWAQAAGRVRDADRIGGDVWLAQLGVHTGYVDGLLGPLILVAIGVGFSWTIETMVVNHFGGSP